MFPDALSLEFWLRSSPEEGAQLEPTMLLILSAFPEEIHKIQTKKVHEHNKRWNTTKIVQIQIGMFHVYPSHRENKHSTIYI